MSRSFQKAFLNSLKSKIPFKTISMLFLNRSVEETLEGGMKEHLGYHQHTVEDYNLGK